MNLLAADKHIMVFEIVRVMGIQKRNTEENEIGYRNQ